MTETLLEKICRCLAFHTIESELTLQFVEPPIPEVTAQAAEARRLIAEAGFNFDDLYPVEDRPTGSATPPTDTDGRLAEMKDHMRAVLSKTN